MNGAQKKTNNVEHYRGDGQGPRRRREEVNGGSTHKKEEALPNTILKFFFYFYENRFIAQTGHQSLAFLNTEHTRT